MDHSYGKRCRRHRKVRYLSEHEAENVCIKLRRSLSMESARPYYEPRCNCWHITTKKPRNQSVSN